MLSHLASLWNRGLDQLVNGLFPSHETSRWTKWRLRHHITDRKAQNPPHPLLSRTASLMCNNVDYNNGSDRYYTAKGLFVHAWSTHTGSVTATIFSVRMSMCLYDCCSYTRNLGSRWLRWKVPIWTSFFFFEVKVKRVIKFCHTNGRQNSSQI